MDPSLRASDADREAVVGELARHLSEGRLTLVEYEERAGQAYAARTIGDLLPLTSDLPGQPSLPSATLPARGDADLEARHDDRTSLRNDIGGLLTAPLICTGVWLAIGISSGEFGYFWPIWVILPCLVVAVIRVIKGRGD